MASDGYKSIMESAPHNDIQFSAKGALLTFGALSQKKCCLVVCVRIEPTTAF